VRAVAPSGDPHGLEEGGNRWENGYRLRKADTGSSGLFLLSADHTGIEVEDTVVEIIEDSQGRAVCGAADGSATPSWWSCSMGARNWTWCSIWGESSSTRLRHPEYPGRQGVHSGSNLYPVSAAAAVGTAVGAGFHCFNVPGPNPVR